MHLERAYQEDTVGVATGMYYTLMGGDIMFIEVKRQQRATTPVATADTENAPAGFGNLVLTGSAR